MALTCERGSSSLQSKPHPWERSDSPEKKGKEFKSPSRFSPQHPLPALQQTLSREDWVLQPSPHPLYFPVIWSQSLRQRRTNISRRNCWLFCAHSILFTIDRQTLQLLRFHSKSLKKPWNVLSQKLKSYWFQASWNHYQGLCLIFFVAMIHLSCFLLDLLDMENLSLIRSALQLQEICVNESSKVPIWANSRCYLII